MYLHAHMLVEGSYAYAPVQIWQVLVALQELQLDGVEQARQTNSKSNIHQLAGIKAFNGKDTNFNINYFLCNYLSQI